MNLTVTFENGIDLELLVEQKAVLSKIIMGEAITDPERDLMDGIMMALDVIHDKIREDIKPKALSEKAEKESRTMYPDKEIIVRDEPVPNNHPFAIRGKYCDFYKTMKWVHVYEKA